MTATPDPRDRSGDDDADDRYAFVDLRDEPPPPPPRRRPAARRRPAPARPGRGRRSSEYAIGALVGMAAVGFGTYHLTYEVAGYPHDLTLIASGLAAGLATWSGRALAAARRALARVISPRAGR